MNEPLTIGAAAKAAGVHRDTISRWLREGRIKGSAQGRAVLIEPAELARAMGRTCAHCGAAFEAADPRAEYCSEACAVAVQNARAKAKRAAAGLPRGRPPLHRAPILQQPLPPAIRQRVKVTVNGAPPRP